MAESGTSLRMTGERGTGNGAGEKGMGERIGSNRIATGDCAAILVAAQAKDAFIVHVKIWQCTSRSRS
jgi:hypothetical protein